MEKNDEIELDITGLGSGGEGVGHFDGMAIFVNGGLPGDRVLAGITRVKKTYAYARIIEIITPSEDRVTPPCPVADRCGGCQLQSLSYPAQLRYKQDKVRDDLLRIGGFQKSQVDSVMEPIIGMENPLHYRNKAQYPVSTDRDGNIVMGFYARHSHRVVEPEGEEGCLLGEPSHVKILNAVKQWMTSCSVKPYDEGSGSGFVRHVLIRRGFRTDQVMVCLVTTPGKLKSPEKLINLLLAADPRIVSIVRNINAGRNNVILGEKTVTLQGADRIEDMVGDVRFQISAQSFFQVNPVQMEKLYSKALDYADLSGSERVYDLYCGIGSISLFLAGRAGHVTGIEIVPRAIDDARVNARLNHIENVDFYAGATEDILPGLAQRDIEENGSGPDVVVLDPPRKGCASSVVDTILKVSPERIVYVSCDPATLARDLKLMCADGRYELQKVCPVDQFGNSVHVEVVVMLSRAGGDGRAL